MDGLRIQLMRQKIIHTIAILGLVLGVMSGPAYAVTNKISVNLGSGSIIVGPNSNTCNAGLAGAVRYMSGSPGTLAWCDGVTAAWVPVGGSSVTPGGSNTYVQFNSGGSSLGGVAGYVYDLTNNIMSITTSATGALRTGNGTVSAPSHGFTASTTTGMWQSGANTALDFVVAGITALQLGTASSAINYISVIPSTTASAPIMRVEGRDMVNDGTGSQGGTLTIVARDASTTGAGGPLTVTGGAGNGSGSGGDVSLTGAASSFWGLGGDVLVAGGNGGSSSGNGGSVTFNAGTATSGTAGSILTQISGTTYMRVSSPSTANSSVLFLRPDAVAFPGGTTAQRPSTGVNGMIRYNTSTSKLETYQAGAWTNVLAGVSSVDDFTDAVTNYSATLGSSGNSLYSMFLGSFSGTFTTAGAQYNTGAGFSALRRLTSGVENTAFGYPALNNLTSGSYNTAIGSYALGTDTDTISRVFSDNTAFGDDALYHITSGTRNTIFAGGENVTSGSDNTSVNGLGTITTQSQNTSFGIDTLNNGTPSYSTALGQGAGLWDNGTYNVFVGINSHNSNATTNYSTGFGANTLYDSTGNANNTAMGINAGQYLTTGNNNTYFGGNAGFFVGKTTSSGALVLGPGPGAYQVVMTNELNISDVIFASTGGTNYFKIDANQHMNYKGSVPTIGT
ncbi:MAG: hypothetical protein JWO78_1218, partial [Micavibrio sp.]|nr:hypothetical protein [Micavibrio sp.]